MTRAFSAALIVVAALAVGGPGPAVAAPASPDLRARELFQQHQYADALAIYTDLYARTQHPTYLRNAGRCHQMLRQPEQAIAYFQRYLHDAHDLSPAERAEVEGYIAEMQALQAASPPAPLPGVPPPPAAEPALAAQAPAPAATPLTHRWWLWTGIGAVVVGGVIASVVIAGHGSSRLPCPDGAFCPP